MESFQALWTNLTDAQATLIAAGGTIFSAFIVAILAPMFLKNSVKGIEEAADLARKNAVRISENFGDLNEQFSAFEKNLAGLQNRINDFVAESSAESPEGDPVSGVISPDDLARKTLRDTWFELRDKLETDASDPRLNGHTRGKYGRIDRRDPAALLSSMEADGNLRGIRSDWDRAQDIYFTFRGRNSNPPTPSDLATLMSLRDRILSGPFEPKRNTRRNGPNQNPSDPPQAEESPPEN